MGKQDEWKEVQQSNDFLCHSLMLQYGFTMYEANLVVHDETLKQFFYQHMERLASEQVLS